MITALNASDVIVHRERLVELFSYCKLKSSGELPNRCFSEEKIDSLISYLSDGRAYLFAECEGGELYGFLWACRVVRENEERMHILYFAVSEDRAGRGIGSALLLAIEREATLIGLSHCELNVHIHNESARHFYEKRGYKREGDMFSERVIFVKQLP